LEEVAWEEIRETIPGAVRHAQDRGKLFFDGGEPGELLSLRAIDNAFAFVARFSGVTADVSALEMVQERVRRLDYDAALAAHARVHGEPADRSFRITTRRSGDHEFRSPDVMKYAGAAIVERFGWRVDLTQHDLEIRVDIVGDECLVGIRLSTDTLNREIRVAHSPASLKPPVAYCLVRLAQPEPGEVFVDPMCGAGTIALQRALYRPAGVVLAGDIGAEEPSLTLRNARACEAAVQVFRWDARRLPLARESVDKIVCNPPWGRRSGSHKRNRHLFPGFLREANRVLREGGRAVLLSLERRLVLRLLKRHPRLELERALPVSIAEMKPSVYCVRKT
jgi:23S rRNA G2445 N2-methylase RlmL